ncbi:MAG: TIGR04141 family sporadically distributed protein [Candidatus Manganitrophus sp.]|nr:TIGR04141 family sporadically distributed protein [Candidatus Manganitrophus sp.]
MATITIYRLNGIDIFNNEGWREVFVEPDSVTEVELNSGIEARLFLSLPPARPPDWVEYLELITKNSLSVRKREAAGAVLLVKPDSRKKLAYAATWGTGHFLLHHDRIQPDLGLRSALNLLAENEESNGEWNPERVRAVRTKRVGPTTLLSQIQASRKTSVDSFPISLDADHLKQVTGTPSDPETWGSTITGGVSLHVRRPEHPEAIRTLCRKIEKVYHSEQYKEKYGWVDNVVPVNDETLKERAIVALIQQLRSGDITGVSLAPPTIVDWEKCDHFEIRWEKESVKHEVPSIDELIRFLMDQDVLGSVSRQDLERRGSLHSVDAAGDKTASWPLLKCFTAEFTFENQTYILDEGTLFLIAKDYLAALKDFTDQIPRLAIELPKTKAKEKEDQYNKRLVGSLGDAVLLDKNTVLRPHASAVEICDVALKSRHLMHVKRGLSSSTLSHLFAQGVVSAELLHMDGEFRKKVEAKLKKLKAHPPNDFEWLHKSPFKTGECEVAYIIMTGKKVEKASKMLPFFSKVNLRLRCHELRRMGFSYSLCLVPPGG